jgi:hypothetical protein
VRVLDDIRRLLTLSLEWLVQYTAALEGIK